MQFLPVYLYPNALKPQSIAVAQRLTALFLAQGVDVLCPADVAQALRGAQATPLDGLQAARALIAIGGDGTLLRAAPIAAQKGVAMLGIHTGAIGFLMERDEGALHDTVHALLDGAFELEERMLLCCSGPIAPALALNDCSITRGEHPGVMCISVYANGEKVYDLTGDGVLISTPTGATAYALAAGAPILHPNADCLLITPLCAREILARPVVVPSSAMIELKVAPRQERAPQLSLDGQIVMPLKDTATVNICRAKVKAKFIRFERTGFFEQLRIKQAHWNHF